ncbi:MAG: hypothetical protein IK079_06630 [Desulfovibrio sp.]|nr:hypothetical protein [Desulfovibrio sp.]
MKKFLFFSLLFFLFLPQQARSKESDLLKKLLIQNANTKRIEATFDQEKKFAFLNKPVYSHGLLYFEKTDANTFKLLFTYLDPVNTGIWCQGDLCYSWTKPQPLRLATGSEALVLKQIVAGILPWLKFEQKTLEEVYTVVEDSTSCLHLRAKKKTNIPLFQICANEDGLLTSLQFTEVQADTTKLSFTHVVRNGEPKRTLPDGTVLP